MGGEHCCGSDLALEAVTESYQLSVRAGRYDNLSCGTRKKSQKKVLSSTAMT